jgi:hypothetical protein
LKRNSCPKYVAQTGSPNLPIGAARVHGHNSATRRPGGAPVAPRPGSWTCGASQHPAPSSSGPVGPEQP